MESAGTQQEAGRPLWLWLTAAIWAVVVLLDLVLTADAVLIGLLAVPPLVASLRCSPSETLGVGVGSLGAAAALGAADGIFGSTDHMVRLITVALAGGRLVRAFEAPVEIAGRKVASSASIGVVTATGEGETAEGLLSAADAAMYGAKQEGGARYMVFDEGMRSRAGERMKIESELRDALEREELTVFYQPQIDLRTGEPVGLEALVRWRHPQRGLLQPAQFIDVAEESGLIEQLGARVLEQACLDFSSIESRRRERLRTMSVNLSAVQFASPRLAEMVAGVLERCGVEPPTLCLEITETTLVTGAAATSDVLSALQELGEHVAR